MTSTNWRRTNKEELILVDKNLLRHLAKKYPDVKSATEEIVNRNAILTLPNIFSVTCTGSTRRLSICSRVLPV